MEKELEPLRITALTNFEVGQLTNRHLTEIGKLAPSQNAPSGGAQFTDGPLNAYLGRLTSAQSIYQLSLAQVQKNDETEKIELADKAREKAISAFNRAIKTHLLSEDQEEVDAAKSLNNLLKSFKNLQSLNFESETIGIDKLVDELEKDNYQPKVMMLNLGQFVKRMDASNSNFKTLFDGRMEGIVSTVSYNAKSLRKVLAKEYKYFCDYVLSMARAHEDNDEFNNILLRLNNTRKYYSDMLARRTVSVSEAAAVKLPDPVA